MRRALVLLCVLLAFGCDNYRARAFGGEMKITLPPNTKLVNVTWKDTDFWYLTRPMRLDEKPETYTFHENSTLGVAQGTVTIVETRTTASGGSDD